LSVTVRESLSLLLVVMVTELPDLDMVDFVEE
jgi:hypothetical protein